MSGRRDSGSASIYVLAGCLLIGLLALVPTITGAAAFSRHRAAVAADAAALAAAHTADADQLADAAPAARGDLTARGCARAAAVAAAVNARLASCRTIRCAGGAESVQVELRVELRLAGLPLPTGSQVAAVARAGAAVCRSNLPP